MKTCTKCGVEKPLSEFYVLPVGHSGRVNPGRFPECKACNIARARAHQVRQRVEDPAKFAADRARWARNARLRQYGLIAGEYDAMLAEQDGKCAICGTSDPGGAGKGSDGQFPVDHDHETGAVRGLLCHGCNAGLGRFGDDPDRLLSAVAYLLARQNVLEVVF